MNPETTSKEPPPGVTKEQYIFHNVAVGDMSDVIPMLEKENFGLDIQDVYGNTLLHWACYRGNLELATYLIQKGAGVAIPNTKDGHTALHWASLQGEIEIMNLLIEHKAPVNAPDHNGHTPIFFAADNNRSVAAHMLIRSGASIRTPDNKGRTPLHMASAKGFSSVVALLIAGGANVDASDEEGKTPLSLAAKYDQVEVFEDLLRDGGADITVRAKDNTNALDVASENVKQILIAAKKRPQDFFKYEGHTTNKIVRTVLYSWIMHALAIASLYFEFGWIAGIIATSVWGGICYNLLNWPPRDERNFFFAGLAFITYLTMVYQSLFVIDPNPNLTDSPSWYFAKCGEIGLFFSYFILLFKYKDPGNIDLNPEVDYQILSTKDLKRGGNTLNICAPCQQRRPLRSKHVRQTGRCVARFDHYCDWIGNAVGEKNHKPFLVFVFFVNVHCISYAYRAYQALPLSAEEFWYFRVYEHFVTNSILVFTFLESIFFVVAMGGQLLQQISLIANNLTLNEAINMPRYRYFFNKNNEFVNPFDRGGKIANIADFFSPATNWSNVFYIHQLPQLGQVQAGSQTV